MGNSLLTIEAEAGRLSTILGAGSVGMVLLDAEEWPVFLALALLLFVLANVAGWKNGK